MCLRGQETDPSPEESPRPLCQTDQLFLTSGRNREVGGGVGNQCRPEPSVLILLVGTVAMTERTGLERRKLRVYLGLVDKIQAKFCMGYIHPKTLFVVIGHSNLTRRPLFFYVLDQPVGSDPHCVPDIGFADLQICRPSDSPPRERRC